MAHPQNIVEAFNNMTMQYRPGNMMQGNAIRNVQICVRDTDDPNYNPSFVDGVYGPATENAVRIYQMSRGMKPADGIVGRVTRQALWDEYENILKTEGYMATNG